MGCSAPGGFQMSLFGRRSDADQLRAKLERKLWLARESPDTSFDLAECALRTVPSGIFSLCRVFRKEILNLQNNSLSHLEDGGDLKDLFLIKVLTIAFNKFHKLPDEVRYLANLRELHVNNNELKYLPDAIGDLIQLRTLDASHNLLKTIPTTLGQLKKLSKLSISGNSNLKSLPNQLCNAHNLSIITLDASNFIYPSADILSLGTAQIMKFLCHQSDVTYISPVELSDDDTSPCLLSPYAALSPADHTKNARSQFADWEAHEEHLQQLENEVHEASKKQREKFLQDYTEEQKKLDVEFSKIQSEKDIERVKLIRQIQEEEFATEHIVIKLLQMSLSNPQQIQQFLEHDQREHDRLLELCRTNYDNLKKMDTLKAMEGLLHEECEYEKTLKNYGETQSEVKESFLLRELNDNYELSDLLKSRDRLQHTFVEKLLNDENVQKAAVGALLEKCDARSWGLIQEISLVESNLGKLSVIELDRRKLQFNENLDNLEKQRLQLSLLLVDLLDQQESRRDQLSKTLQDMEKEKKTSTDFWLIRYQQLLDNLPTLVVSAQKQLDPTFANYLLQEGVIHCLPFLISKLSSIQELRQVDHNTLQQLGVRLTSDRNSILKAIGYYLEEVDARMIKIQEPGPSDEHEPTAPPMEIVSEETETAVPVIPATNEELKSECVVCMDNYSVIVFIPCGHLCCCLKCSDAIEQYCPMCRQKIGRKIRVLPQ